MRKPGENVFDFISAMSPAEKRYFKAHYGNKQNQIVSLFDFINKMSAYDESIVKAHFRNSKISKNLKVYKVQLLDLLLKSMVSYNSKRNPRSKVRIELEEVDILLKKKMFNLARKKLDRLHQICKDNELTLMTVALLGRELSIMVQTPHHFENQDLATNPKLDQIIQHLDAYKMSMLLNRFVYRVHTATHSEIDQIAGEFMDFLERYGDRELKHASQRTLRIKNDVLARIYRKQGKLEEAMQYFKLNYLALKDQKSMRQHSPFNFMTYASNYMASLICVGQRSAAKALVQELKSYGEKYPYVGWTRLYPYFYSLLLAHQQQDLEAINEELNEADRLMKEHSKQDVPATFLIYLFKICHYLSTDRLNCARFYVDVLKGRDPGLDPDWMTFANWLSLLVFFLSEEQELLDRQYKILIKSLQDENSEEEDLDWFKGTYRLMNLPLGERRQAAKELGPPITKHLVGQSHQILFSDIAQKWLDSVASGRVLAKVRL